jgi:hypothetical protein
VPLPSGFYRSWPSNYTELIADLSRYWGWPAGGPGSGFEITGSRLIYWLDQANRIITERDKR